MNDALTILRALAKIVDADGTIIIYANSSIMRDIRFCLAEDARAEAEKAKVLRELEDEDDLWNGAF